MPSQLSRSRGVSIMVYGVPGSGKTRLIGTGKDTLIIRPPTDHTDSITEPDNVVEEVVHDWAEMSAVFCELQQGAAKNYRWVWLDSISLFQEIGLRNLFNDAVQRNPHRGDYGPDKGEYGINMWRIADFISNMVGLAVDGITNFGITAHPFEWYDPVQSEDVWAPYIQGVNMSPKICGYMNMVAYLQEVRRDDKPPTRVLLTQAPGFVGKDQWLCFPELKSGRRGVVDPTMDKIEKAISSGRRRRPRTKRRKG